MKKIILPALAALSLVAGTLTFVQAQPAPKDGPREQQRHARAERGPVTKEQFGQRRMDALKAADKNGDGILSRDELEQFAMKHQAQRAANRMMRRLDIDGNGTVTLAEIERHQQKRFTMLDRNDDGKLERHERRQMREMRRAQNGAGKHWHRGPGHDHGKPHVGPRHHRSGPDNQKIEL